MKSNIAKDQRLKMSIDEAAFSELKYLVEKKRISLIKELNIILETTKNHSERDGVAKILYCIGDKSSLKSFITAIRQPYTKNHRGYLVLCCKRYDCSRFLLFFTELALSENHWATNNAIDVIEQMNGPFKNGEFKKTIVKIEAFLQKNYQSERSNVLKELLAFLLDKFSP